MLQSNHSPNATDHARNLSDPALTVMY
uniref:Uncharacterized protein n=1 Tax=Arundo donax TaxID=35708 RepID=A0A0A8Z326_ARUDO